MSKATKRKHVTKEVLDEFVSLKDGQEIAMVIGSRGNNLHEVETASGLSFLASMPSKFRKNVWVKRGMYVILEDIPEGEKVKAEIIYILYKQQIQDLYEKGLWPSTFPCNEVKCVGNVITSSITKSEKNGSESDDDNNLFVNCNRPTITYEVSSTESEEENDDDENDTGSSDEDESITNSQ